MNKTQQSASHEFLQSFGQQVFFCFREDSKTDFKKKKQEKNPCQLVDPAQSLRKR